MLDLRNFATTEQLKDGTSVTVRAVRPDDKGRIVAAFRELEAETIYTRYFQSMVQTVLVFSLVDERSIRFMKLL